MKKTFEKIAKIIIAALTVALVVLLIVTVFVPSVAQEANNLIVQITLIIMAVVLFSFLAVIIVFSFIDNEKVKEILLEKMEDSSKKVSLGVIKSLARIAVRSAPHAKIFGIRLIATDDKRIIFCAKIKVIQEKDDSVSMPKVSFILEQVTTALKMEFIDVLDLEFDEINLNLVSTKNFDSPNADEVNRLSKKRKDANKNIVGAMAVALEGVEDTQGAGVQAASEDASEAAETANTETEEEAFEKPVSKKARKKDVSTDELLARSIRQREKREKRRKKYEEFNEFEPIGEDEHDAAVAIEEANSTDAQESYKTEIETAVESAFESEETNALKDEGDFEDGIVAESGLPQGEGLMGMLSSLFEKTEKMSNDLGEEEE